MNVAHEKEGLEGVALHTHPLQPAAEKQVFGGAAGPAKPPRESLCEACFRSLFILAILSTQKGKALREWKERRR
jgi:hypothetical protein